MNDSKHHLSRFAAIFAGGTLLSRITGLASYIVVGAMVPHASRDAFLLAFKLPNMFRDMLGEGAVNAAFIPVFAASEERESPEAYRAMVSAVMSAMIVVFGVLTVLGLLVIPFVPTLLEWIRPLTGAASKDPEQLRIAVRLMQWTFPYLLMIGVAVFAMAPLFTARHYSTPSWAPVLLNIAMIACCLVFYRWFPDPAWALVVGVWIGGLAQLAVLLAAMKRHTGVLWPNFQLRHPAVGQVFWLLGPVILGQATGEVNKLVDSFFAYSLEDGTVSALFFSNRLVQLPLSIFGIAVSVAILPSIARAGARNETEEIRQTLMHGFRQTFFLIVPATIGLLVLGRPIVRLLFQRGHFDAVLSDRTTIALFYYGLGLLSFAWVKVAVQGFFAVRDTKTPVIIASASMFLNILLNCALVGPMGYRGLALATTVSYTVNFVLLFVILRNRFGPLWDADMTRALLRITLATALMGVAAYGIGVRAERFFGVETVWAQTASVTLAIGAAAAVYAIVCKSLRVEELDHFLLAFTRRR